MSSTLAPKQDSPYLDGVFAPVVEERTLDDLEVIGEIPAGLSGMFVRNSPNPRFRPLGAYHWFDGDGMLHGVELDGGRVRYLNRYVRTQGFAIEDAAGEAVWTGINMPVQFDNPHGHAKNTANTDVVFHKGRLLALWWLAHEPYEIALPTLDTLGAYDFDGTLDCGFSAHPKVDPVTGEMVFIDFDVVKPPYLTMGVVGADGHVKHTAPIDLPGARLLHDIAITETHTILMDLPLTWDPTLLRQGKRRVVFLDDTPSRFGIVPRYGTNEDVRWFEAEPGYVYHSINAWHEGDQVVMYGCRTRNPVPPSRDAWDPSLPSLGFLQLQPFFHVWRFDLATGSVKEERLDDIPSEFPRMDNRRLGRPSRYSYNPRIAAAEELLFDGVMRYDHVAGTSEAFGWGEGRFGGEVVFAPDPDRDEEDAGWLLTFVADAREDTSELVVLDAADVAAGPLARVRIPGRVPIGYHAWWVDRAGVDQHRAVRGA